ncbi:MULTISPECIES: carbohydrate ABC transporter permease [unclassified Jeotgalicoccus]|uniref:carbohydrate ABC transporter permease n=1 Tax=unclassified Jeotgalicoccus TaxID=2630462 RepID=UPI001414E855|nr:MULTISPECIES: carbohydrate ABC transporter permease [unclassified Jeotgalicoccus]QQD84782.1 carbohydrate ABC transporter permease [Jeotgalicoccus sp. ATCC 8456]
MKIRQFIWHILIIIFIVVALYPILFAVSNSFKHLNDAFVSTINLIPNSFTLENYQGLYETIPLFKITLNTFVIASIITFFKIVTSLLAAYALTYFNFKFKKATYFLLISTIFIPFTVTMIPNYLIVSHFDLIDSVWGVILPQLADAIGIFMLTQAMRNIPKPLIEAAQVDNISTFNIMKDHVLPIVRPALTSTAIWFFILAWNDYVWPLLMLRSRDSYTLPLALQLFVSSEGGTNFTVAMALSVITMAIPLILYLIFQRYIINTFSSSGIK